MARNRRWNLGRSLGSEKRKKKKKTSNVQRPTFNVQRKRARTHFEFFSAVRMLAEKDPDKFLGLEKQRTNSACEKGARLAQ